MDLCPVGALTNGPYSFTARPWELSMTESIDVLESVNANTHIFWKGGEIMRTLPRINEDVNEEWISDKSRHGWDGVRRQRLNTPFVRKKDGSFEKWTWEKALQLIVQKMNSFKPEEMCGIIGNDVDIEACCAFRDLLHRMNIHDIDVLSNSHKLN